MTNQEIINEVESVRWWINTLYKLIEKGECRVREITGKYTPNDIIGDLKDVDRSISKFQGSVDTFIDHQ